MGSTLLSLTNKALRHFNEVPLTSTTLATATGFQATVLDYVNDSIRSIQQAEYEWPFNWNESTITLVPGQTDPQLYALGSTTESVDWETFSVVRDDTLGVQSQAITYLDYDEYFQRYRDQDKAQVGSTSLGVQPPKYVFRPQKDLYVGFSPVPDRAYQVRYEWWGYNTDLTAHSDTTTIPTRFDHVIIAGVLAQGYSFRQNPALFNIYQKRHETGISKMRELLINRYKRVRDGRRGGAG